MIKEINFLKLNENAVTPSKGTPYSVGYDLTATSIRYDSEYDFLEYGTGIAVEIPDGYACLLAPRSSVTKKGLFLANSVGVGDPDYRGELTFRYKSHSLPLKQYKYIPRGKIYEVGERIGQLLIVKVENLFVFIEQDELSETVRGEGGYGSTGK